MKKNLRKLAMTLAIMGVIAFGVKMSTEARELSITKTSNSMQTRKIDPPTP